jgi:hypothetical protein
MVTIRLGMFAAVADMTPRKERCMPQQPTPKPEIPLQPGTEPPPSPALPPQPADVPPPAPID